MRLSEENVETNALARQADESAMPPLKQIKKGEIPHYMTESGNSGKCA